MWLWGPGPGSGASGAPGAVARKATRVPGCLHPPPRPHSVSLPSPASRGRGRTEHSQSTPCTERLCSPSLRLEEGPLGQERALLGPQPLCWVVALAPLVSRPWGTRAGWVVASGVKNGGWSSGLCSPCPSHPHCGSGRAPEPGLAGRQAFTDSARPLSRTHEGKAPRASPRPRSGQKQHPHGSG